MRIKRDRRGSWSGSSEASPSRNPRPTRSLRSPRTPKASNAYGPRATTCRGGEVRDGLRARSRPGLPVQRRAGVPARQRLPQGGRLLQALPRRDPQSAEPRQREAVPRAGREPARGTPRPWSGKPDPARPVVPDPAVTERPATDDPGRTQRWLGIGAMVVGGAALGIGVYYTTEVGRLNDERADLTAAARSWCAWRLRRRARRSGAERPGAAGDRVRGRRCGDDRWRRAVRARSELRALVDRGSCRRPAGRTPSARSRSEPAHSSADVGAGSSRPRGGISARHRVYGRACRRPPAKPRGVAVPVAGDDYTDVTSPPAPGTAGTRTTGARIPRGPSRRASRSRSARRSRRRRTSTRPLRRARTTTSSRAPPSGSTGSRRRSGRAGWAVVFSAVHPLIGKRAAIKILKKELCADPHTLERFVDEARVVNEIGHPNIVDIFAFGEMPDGRSYFVMEWLKGATRARGSRGESSPPPRSARSCGRWRARSRPRTRRA